MAARDRGSDRRSPGGAGSGRRRRSASRTRAKWQRRGSCSNRSATASEDELRAYCRERLAPYKVPGAVEFRADLPKTMVGKVLRRMLTGSRVTAPMPAAPPSAFPDVLRQHGSSGRIAVNADSVSSDAHAASIDGHDRPLASHPDRAHGSGGLVEITLPGRMARQQASVRQIRTVREHLADAAQSGLPGHRYQRRAGETEQHERRIHAVRPPARSRRPVPRRVRPCCRGRRAA